MYTTWVFESDKWEKTFDYDRLRYAIEDCRTVDDVWAITTGQYEGDDGWVIVLLANSAYAPAGELMALLRGEREAA